MFAIGAPEMLLFPVLALLVLYAVRSQLGVGPEPSPNFQP
jgi:hypothetical protein